MLTDHGFLRTIWTHEYEIAPGVWRSNQPSPRRIERWAKRGIRSVLLLRGRPMDDPILKLEVEACVRHGLRLHSYVFRGSRLFPKDYILGLLDIFKTIEKPFVFHCKSGIDRTGFVSFLYLVAETKTPPVVARRQLSLRYLHLRGNRHGILDFVADAYLSAFEQTGIGLRAWVETAYDPDELTARYEAGEHLA